MSRIEELYRLKSECDKNNTNIIKSNLEHIDCLEDVLECYSEKLLTFKCHKMKLDCMERRRKDILKFKGDLKRLDKGLDDFFNKKFKR